MKNLFPIILSLLLLVGLGACTNENDVKPITPVESNETLRVNGGNILVNLPTAEYEYEYVVNIPAEASWISVNKEETLGRSLILTVEQNSEGVVRNAVVTVTEGGNNALVATINISQIEVALRSGEFVIEEVYFTSTALQETGVPDKLNGDQYLKIRNNTDADLYADGMMLILGSSVNSGQNISIIEGSDFRKNGCAGSAFYIIPGGGNDVLVKAGESLIITNNAQNHTVANVDSWDATKANFEWFDVSSNNKIKDIDNFAVPNLDKWYANTATVHILHNRGYSSVAIAMPPVGMNAEQFLANYVIKDAKYIFHSPNGSNIDMSVRGYNVPMEWVLDAVNTGDKNNFFVSPWYSTLDAGYAWCGIGDGDISRHNKSIIRKSGADGKLVDTNNSTNDFDSNVKASLIR